jgi:hypothetical protein
MHKEDLYAYMWDEFLEEAMDVLDIPTPQTFL